MARRTASFVCQNCGAAFNRWQGKCEACGEWNTLVEESAAAGAPAGAGALTPNGSTAELVGIATLPEFRRRGVASAVSSYLVDRYFRQGGEIAWLSAEDQIAQIVDGVLIAMAEAA